MIHTWPTKIDTVRKYTSLKDAIIETANLNKKTEIYQGCKHKHFKFLADCKVT